ncbi:MAG: helix-turn-helix domain-containing protein [Oscillospiraceae bacterium]|jgi:transcriptional regulator with XRE-family HTH domain|nr:helix-turn-helix domain-containing protein [Oscillospiraceae bacterium]
MNIGTNLRRLRRERDMTQEDLAGALGVSFQAVSKWERGEGYPDITLLPSIAVFFRVSVDELMGMDEVRRQEELAGFVVEYARRRGESDGSAESLDRAADVYRDALKKYPNEWFLMYWLANSLVSERGDEQLSDGCFDEAIALYERIVKYADNAELQIQAQSALAGVCFRAGLRDRAVVEAQNLVSVDDREKLLATVTRGAEQLQHIQTLLARNAYEIFAISRFAAPTDTYVFDTDDDVFGFTNAERIRILQIGVDAIELLRDEGDYCTMPFRASYCYRSMAELALTDGDVSRAIDYLERAADYAIESDTIPDGAVYTSVLRRGFEARSDQRGGTLDLLQRIECYPDYPEKAELPETRLRERALLLTIRDEPRVRAIAERLRAAAV